MSKLVGYSEVEQQQIKVLACRLIEGQIVKGEIPFTDEAIKAAMPQAINDAKAVITAVGEYLCG